MASKGKSVWAIHASPTTLTWLFAFIVFLTSTSDRRNMKNECLCHFVSKSGDESKP